MNSLVQREDIDFFLGNIRHREANIIKLFKIAFSSKLGTIQQKKTRLDECSRYFNEIEESRISNENMIINKYARFVMKEIHEITTEAFINQVNSLYSSTTRQIKTLGVLESYVKQFDQEIKLEAIIRPDNRYYVLADVWAALIDHSRSRLRSIQEICTALSEDFEKKITSSALIMNKMRQNEIFESLEDGLPKKSQRMKRAELFKSVANFYPQNYKEELTEKASDSQKVKETQNFPKFNSSVYNLKKKNIFKGDSSRFPSLPVRKEKKKENLQASSKPSKKNKVNPFLNVKGSKMGCTIIEKPKKDSVTDQRTISSPKDDLMIIKQTNFRFLKENRNIYSCESLPVLKQESISEKDQIDEGKAIQQDTSSKENSSLKEALVEKVFEYLLAMNMETKKTINKYQIDYELFNQRKESKGSSENPKTFERISNKSRAKGVKRDEENSKVTLQHSESTTSTSQKSPGNYSQSSSNEQASQNNNENSEKSTPNNDRKNQTFTYRNNKESAKIFSSLNILDDYCSENSKINLLTKIYCKRASKSIVCDQSETKLKHSNSLSLKTQLQAKGLNETEEISSNKYKIEKLQNYAQETPLEELLQTINFSSMKFQRTNIKTKSLLEKDLALSESNEINRIASLRNMRRLVKKRPLSGVECQEFLRIKLNQ